MAKIGSLATNRELARIVVPNNIEYAFSGWSRPQHNHSSMQSYCVDQQITVPCEQCGRDVCPVTLDSLRSYNAGQLNPICSDCQSR